MKIDKQKAKKLRDAGLSFGQIAKEVGATRQAVHSRLKHEDKYTIKKFWASLYWEAVDCDDDPDGYLHIVSTIDGSETKLELKDILTRAGLAKLQETDGGQEYMNNIICVFFGHKEISFAKWIICARCRKNIGFQGSKNVS